MELPSVLQDCSPARACAAGAALAGLLLAPLPHAAEPGDPATALEQCLAGLCLDGGIDSLDDRAWRPQRTDGGLPVPLVGDAEATALLSRYHLTIDGRALSPLKRVTGACDERPFVLVAGDDGSDLEVTLEFVPQPDASQLLRIREIVQTRFGQMEQLRADAGRLCDDLRARFPPDDPAEATGCDRRGASYGSAGGSLAVRVSRDFDTETEGFERVTLRRIDEWYLITSPAERRARLQRLPGCPAAAAGSREAPPAR